MRIAKLKDLPIGAKVRYLGDYPTTEERFVGPPRRKQGVSLYDHPSFNQLCNCCDDDLNVEVLALPGETYIGGKRGKDLRLADLQPGDWFVTSDGNYPLMLTHRNGDAVSQNFELTHRYTNIIVYRIYRRVDKNNIVTFSYVPPKKSEWDQLPEDLREYIDGIISDGYGKVTREQLALKLKAYKEG